jgi:CarD family transcriptional regulator
MRRDKLSLDNECFRDMIAKLGGTMFQIGDYAVCPGHGVGQIVDIEEREGCDFAFYMVKIIANGMKVMVPTNSELGIRTLIGSDDVSDVFSVLNNHDVELDNSTWNRRYRDYMEKVKTGSLVEIAEVLRELFLLKENKNLSFGEKKMLDQCRELIAQEISISGGKDSVEVKTEINSCFPSSEAV